MDTDGDEMLGQHYPEIKNQNLARYWSRANMLYTTSFGRKGRLIDHMSGVNHKRHRQKAKTWKIK